jgi:hypothetical protein
LNIYCSETIIALKMTIAGEGNCLGYAAHDKSGKLTPFRFNRRAGMGSMSKCIIDIV